MTDKRFKWLLLSASLTVILVAVIWKYPEAVKATDGRDCSLGGYCYIDEYSIIHVSRKCSRLNYKDMTSRRFKVDDMYFYFKDTPVGSLSFCPKCVSDKDYEKIINMFSRQIEDAADKIIKQK